MFALPTLKALRETGHTIVAVYSQPPRPAGRGQKERPSPVHEYALAHGLPVYTPVSLKSAETQAEFAAHKADAAIVVAYGLLLPQAILDACPMGCINVHPSLLPRWRGAAPIQRTIMAGDTQTAIVIMQMDAGLDTGDMLMVEPVAIAPGTNAAMLHDELSQKAAPLVLKTLQRAFKPVKQPTEGVTYAKKITKEECRIDWNRPAADILNQIRGLSPAPGAAFVYQGEQIKIFDAVASAVRECDFMRPAQSGEVISANFDIACEGGKSVLSPLEMQRPGKKRMSRQECLQGFPIPPGSVLG